MAESKLKSAIEAYLGRPSPHPGARWRDGRALLLPPLANLLNAIGGTLRPKGSAWARLAQQGAGHPDFGLYAAKQVQRGRPRDGQLPEYGVVEVKPAGDDAWLTAASDQVSRYWDRYRLVLVTNTRDFVLIGEDATGNPSSWRPSGWRTRWKSSNNGLGTPAPLPMRPELVSGNTCAGC